MQREKGESVVVVIKSYTNFPWDAIYYSKKSSPYYCPNFQIVKE
jgi:hypothetical protein